MLVFSDDAGISKDSKERERTSTVGKESKQLGGASGG